MDLSEKIGIGALAVNGFVFLLGIMTFAYQARQNRKLQRDQLENQKIEIYQRLEEQSKSVFQFEAEHRQTVALCKSNLAPQRLEGMSGTPASPLSDDDAQLIARKFYEITCNLFEVAARLRRKDVVDHEVFASWVAWFFDTAIEWGFRAIWHDLRSNYTSDLRDVFDPIVEELILAWDIPHAEGRFDGYAQPTPAGEARVRTAALEVKAERIDAIEDAFYKRLAKIFECEAVGTWLKNSARPDAAAHPLAFQ